MLIDIQTVRSFHLQPTTGEYYDNCQYYSKKKIRETIKSTRRNLNTFQKKDTAHLPYPPHHLSANTKHSQWYIDIVNTEYNTNLIKLLYSIQQQHMKAIKPKLLLKNWILSSLHFLSVSPHRIHYRFSLCWILNFSFLLFRFLPNISLLALASQTNTSTFLSLFPSTNFLSLFLI